LLAGWRAQGLASAVVVDPAPAAGALAGRGIKVVAALADIPDWFSPGAVVLAVKPQVAGAAVPGCAKYQGALFVSIMAGQTISALAGMLGETAAIVRAMPNTPAAIGQGISVACAGPAVAVAQRQLASRLLGAAGLVEWVEDEALLDAVTAISGGGPAYVFLLAELLQQAGLDQGLPPELARNLARQTVIGSAGLLAASDEAAAALRVAVTSPGGTTERALAILMREQALPRLFAAAIEAATERSRELSR
jgi:pyrroline-5-carboxylate reductase